MTEVEDILLPLVNCALAAAPTDQSDDNPFLFFNLVNLSTEQIGNLVWGIHHLTCTNTDRSGDCSKVKLEMKFKPNHFDDKEHEWKLEILRDTQPISYV